MSDDVSRSEAWQRGRVHVILLTGDPTPWDQATFTTRPNGRRDVVLERHGQRRHIEDAVVVQSWFDPRDRGIEPEPDTDYFEILIQEVTDA